MKRRSIGIAVGSFFLATAAMIAMACAPAPARANASLGTVSELLAAPQTPGQITSLKFSPDGKYVLAQDASSTFVLSREPFAAIFRIDSSTAEPAWFTPDSKSIVISTPDLKVGVWDIASRSRTSAVDASSIAAQCLQTQVSPDAKYVACLDKQTQIQLFDLSTLLSKTKSSQLYDTLINPDRLAVFLATAFTPARFGLVRMTFSPDGQYFVAARSVHPTHQPTVGPGSIAPFATPEDVVKAMGQQRVDGFALTALTGNDLEVRQVLGDMGVDSAFDKAVSSPECCREGDTGHPHGFDRTDTVGRVAIDIPTGGNVALRGDLNAFNWGAIVFLSPAKFVAQHLTDTKTSELINFPDGKLIRKIDLPGNSMVAVADGAGVVLRPTQGPGVQIVNMKSGKSVLGSKNAVAMDIYGENFVTQSGLNEVGIYNVNSLQQLAKATLNAPAVSAKGGTQP